MDLKSDILNAKVNQTHLFFLGQAGFVLKSKKQTLLGVDMYLSQCVERAEGHVGFKRLTPQILAPSDIIFDHIIATHPHYDHFDMDAIPILMSNPHTHLYASINCQQEVKRLMMDERNISYIQVGDYIEADDINIQCVPCDHGTGAPDAVGLVITIDGKRIYIAGDTCLRKDYAEVILKAGPFEVMIAPINGAFGNLSETDCVTLCGIIKPKLVIPCHYGTFISHGGNPGLFMDIIQKRMPDQHFLLMAQGEGITI